MCTHNVSISFQNIFNIDLAQIAVLQCKYIGILGLPNNKVDYRLHNDVLLLKKIGSPEHTVNPLPLVGNNCNHFLNILFSSPSDYPVNFFILLALFEVRLIH